MKFNVGDKVRIKEDLSQCKFGSNAYMEEYAGKEATVVQTFGEGMIILDVDEQDWNWSEEVLEKIEGDNKVKMKRIDYIMNSKNPIKVLAEKFKLELECYECPHNDRYGKCDSNCKEGLREYLEQEIEVNESNLKKINTEPTIDISVKATDEQIDTKEALQKALDEVREQLLKTKGKLIHMKEVEDVVNHPSHYTDGNIEVMDFIEDKQLNFARGNVIKYVSRAGKKDPNKELEDLKKSMWYLNREIERLEKENEHDR